MCFVCFFLGVGFGVWFLECVWHGFSGILVCLLVCVVGVVFWECAVWLGFYGILGWGWGAFWGAFDFGAFCHVVWCISGVLFGGRVVAFLWGHVFA